MKKFVFLIVLFFVINLSFAQEIRVDTTIFFTGLSHCIYDNEKTVELVGVVVISKRERRGDHERIISVEKVIHNPKGGSFSIIPKRKGFEDDMIYAFHDRFLNPRLLLSGDYYIVFYYENLEYKQLLIVLDYPYPQKQNKKQGAHRAHKKSAIRK